MHPTRTIRWGAFPHSKRLLLAVVGALAGLGRALSRRRPRRRCVADLHRMDARLLRDIGVTRTDALSGRRPGRSRDQR